MEQFRFVTTLISAKPAVVVVLCALTAGRDFDPEGGGSIPPPGFTGLESDTDESGSPY